MGSSSAVNFAKTQIGVPYQWGGESPGKDFDCSGLVQAAFKSAGVDLPRTAQAQYDATTKIPVGQQLQAGDLVFFGGSTQSISHVGIYIGNGQMIDAPHTGAQVRIESYQWGDYIGATRPTDPAGVSTLPTSGPVTQGGVVGNYNQVLSKVLSAMNGGSRG
jgi:cell wall-associated NlpC family hydrolase